jgi:Flp pilus assembly pilin Flp
VKSSSSSFAGAKWAVDRRVGRGERAASVVEYALVLCVMSFLVIASLVALGDGTSAPIKRTGTAVEAAPPAPPATTTTSSTTTTTTTTTIP